MAVAVHLEQPLLALESAWYLWLAAVQPPPVSASLPVFRWCVEHSLDTGTLAPQSLFTPFSFRVVTEDSF